MMGSTSWHDDIVQALLIGLVVQIVAYVLCVFCAFLWASWKERMARPTTGESMAESDVEMGTVNVGEGANNPDNPPHGLAANSDVGGDGKLEDSEDTADTRASTPDISTVHGSSSKWPITNCLVPKGQCKNIIEDVKRRASVPVAVDVSHPQQVVVLAG